MSLGLVVLEKKLFTRTRTRTPTPQSDDIMSADIKTETNNKKETFKRDDNVVMAAVGKQTTPKQKSALFKLHLIISIYIITICYTFREEVNNGDKNSLRT